MKRSAIRKTTWTPTRTSGVLLLLGGSMWVGSTGCQVAVSREDGLVHVSVSAPGRYPTWDELASAKERFIGSNARAVMHFPPEEEYVNLHKTTLHVWEVDGNDEDVPLVR